MTCKGGRSASGEICAILTVPRAGLIHSSMSSGPQSDKERAAWELPLSRITARVCWKGVIGETQVTLRRASCSRRLGHSELPLVRSDVCKDKRLPFAS